MTEHTCPYNAVRQIAPYSQLTECGSNGWLCERCQVDAARANTRAIVRAVLGAAATQGASTTSPDTELELDRLYDSIRAELS